MKASIVRTRSKVIVRKKCLPAKKTCTEAIAAFVKKRWKLISSETKKFEFIKQGEWKKIQHRWLFQRVFGSKW